MVTQAALLLDPDEDAPLPAVPLPEAEPEVEPEPEPEIEPEPVEPLVEPEPTPLEVPLAVAPEPDMVPVPATTEPDGLPVVVPDAPLVDIAPEPAPELCPLGEAPLGPAVPELPEPGDAVPEEVFCVVPGDELQAARTRHTRGSGLDFMRTMYHQICVTHSRVARGHADRAQGHSRPLARLRLAPAAGQRPPVLGSGSV
jgi:hypothetical protein